ncbi:putative splicing factor 3a subunit 3 [Tothia fuscella]|uniref:Splicing factor 3a subunit 3 n=1 Tax=Tothia fuscella TaxID=1048955 RepID=A0A9P4NHX3_9PEZI|nr:putative splicing factor 3a subunit 3 [Tothia fuscella]
MIIEEQRVLHEDIERLEGAVAERLREDPKNVRDQLSRDHEISNFLTRIQEQSKTLLAIYEDATGSLASEIQTISTGDPFSEFHKQMDEIKDFHRRYPNEPVENLERAYRKRQGEGETHMMQIDSMFSGEEGYGRYFDLTTLHEEYLNLPGVKGGRRITYIQYLDGFDSFTGIKRSDKLTDIYFQYISALATYLESFMRKTRPLEDLDKIFERFNAEFEKAWTDDEVPGWGKDTSSTSKPALATQGEGTGLWCAVCEKEFNNDNVYKHHLTQRKHINKAKVKESTSDEPNGARSNGKVDISATEHIAITAQTHRLKERAIASKEFMVTKLASAMQTQRHDTRVNVERKQGMTDKERQQEIAALYENTYTTNGDSKSKNADANGDESDNDSDASEKIYNPLKLPLAWDGKPIPFWLYKLHGLGVEFTCEICGNFVYMGRRAFDKHFNEARHIYGLKCLGITSTSLFREITGIKEAVRLWEKMQRDKKREMMAGENVVQMEDGEGNVMPEKVYKDLVRQGLL